MGIFKKGNKIKMKYGSDAEIIDELGEGGQGTVYKVRQNGKDYALKWYHRNIFGNKSKMFYENLEKNIEKGAPNDSFLWPKEITLCFNESFGYLMDLRSKDFYELTDFFTGTIKHPQKHFKSFTTQTNAAINIIKGFRALHNSGYSYQDLNNGNFFINPNNGEVLICDNDNVAPNGQNLGIMGKQRYMAPEIVSGGGKVMPDKYTDRYSLSVILFILLFINHPLEGKYSTPPCLTKALEIEYYGKKPIFILDPNNAINRPIPGTDKNIKLFWPIYPQYIRDAFIKAFSQDVLLHREQRIIEKDWMDIFTRLKSGIIVCPHCKKETFIEKIGEHKCIECGKNINVENAIKFSSYDLPLYPTSKVLSWNVDSSLNKNELDVIGEVVKHPKTNDIGILNCNKENFRVTVLDGTQKMLQENSVMPVKKGFEIEFLTNSKNKGIII